MRAPVAIGTFLLVAFAAPRLSARDESPRSPRNANYTLTATLDATNRLIVGQGRLLWRNTSRNAATELRFHLPWNAWRDDRTTWMREQELAGDRSAFGRAASDHGFIDLTTLAIVGTSGSTDLLAHSRAIAPDDGNEDDRTVLSAPLDHPIAPGESIQIDLAWNEHVPRAYAGTGTIGNNFFIAGWYPKIGVLEDAGWNCHQVHAAADGFADFGTYDVSLNVPKGWVVGATGVQASSNDIANGTTTHRFVENDVNDFAWTTDPDYLDVHELVDEPGLPPIDLRLLLQREHRDQIERHFDAARAALVAYGHWLGTYPYGHLTIVDPVTILDPAVQGASVGDAAYPTLVVAGTRWSARWKDPVPERAIATNIARQFLSAIVGSDDADYAWMDRGISQYLAARVVAAAPAYRYAASNRYFDGLVPWTYDDAPWSRLENGAGLDTYRRSPSGSAIEQTGWIHAPDATMTTDAKAALMLTSLERLVGEDAMQRILMAFYQKNAFSHAKPDDFFQAVNATSGQDFSWFFNSVYRGQNTFDYAVADVLSDVTDSGSYDSRVILRRIGDGVFPVDVRVTFGDGAGVTEHWNGADRWHELRYRRGARVTQVEIDPERVLTLDANYTNNSWTDRPQGAAAAAKWAMHWLDWFEQTLLTYAFFA